MQMLASLFIFFFISEARALDQSSNQPQIQPIEEVNSEIRPLKKVPSKPQKKISKSSHKRNKPVPIKILPVSKGPMEVMGPPKPPADATEMLYPEELGENISYLVVGLANRIDSFFGDERSDDERNGSTLRLIPSYTYYDHKKPVIEMGVNLNLKLVNLEKKAKKLEVSLREEILETTNLKKETSNTGPVSPPSKEEEWHYNFESKLASRPALYYSGKFRVRRSFEQEFFLHHLALSAGWDTDDYWSQKTSFTSDHAIDESILFRVSNEANWYISKKLFQTTHGPSLIQTLNKYNSISYNFRMLFGTEKLVFHHMESGYSINFRHGTPTKRIFIDLIPVYSYPRSGSYHEIRSIELRLEYFFGNVE